MIQNVWTTLLSAGWQGVHFKVEVTALSLYWTPVILGFPLLCMKCNPQCELRSPGWLEWFFPGLWCVHQYRPHISMKTEHTDCASCVYSVIKLVQCVYTQTSQQYGKQKSKEKKNCLQSNELQIRSGSSQKTVGFRQMSMQYSQNCIIPYVQPLY